MLNRRNINIVSCTGSELIQYFYSFHEWLQFSGPAGGEYGVEDGGGSCVICRSDQSGGGRKTQRLVKPQITAQQDVSERFGQ